MRGLWITWASLAMMTVAACGSDDDDAAKFVGSWAYATGSKLSVNCGGQMFEAPFDTIVETFIESGDGLVKNDSQGCNGLEFSVTGAVASLNGSGQSCTDPANGGNPAATFAPSMYTFTISSDHESLIAVIGSATYTPQGGMTCAVTGTNSMSRQ